MHSFPAVEGQPVNNLIFGLAPGLEAHAMQAFNLQRTEQSFRHCIIPAIAPAAHRSAYAVAAQGRLEIGTGILRALIRMEDQTFRRLPPEPCHGQGVDHEVSCHALAHRPANNLPAEQVDDDGQVQPSFPRGDVC